MPLSHRRMLLRVLCSLLLCGAALSDTTVTIYNEWLSQGGRVHYESKRWNKINGLTQQSLIPKMKSVGTAPGRWVNRDLRDNLFPNWPQSSSHHGFPDPSYLQDHTMQAKTFATYSMQLKNYGNYIDDMVWNIEGLHWPDWIDKAQHNDKFPNNLDAASEFVSLMIQSAKDYTGGHLPSIFEALNEPDWVEKYIPADTCVDFHKAVADKVRKKFGIKVSGPSYTSMALRQADENDFAFWKRTQKFLDMSLYHLDFFSFHSYNYLQDTSGKGYMGINEARLFASLDMVENYAQIKTGKSFPLVNTEFGLGLDNLQGVGPDFENGMTDFQTIYQANGFLCSFFNLREVMDRATIFLLSNEQYPGHTSLRNSLFTIDGHALNVTKFFTFWKNLDYDHRYIRVSSEFDGKERTVSSLAFANPNTKELVVLLHNFIDKFQNVRLDFPNKWLDPSTGEETCVLLDDGYPTINAGFKFDRHKLQNTVGLPPTSTCFYKFKTNYNFNGIRTDSQNTYYGRNMELPITNGRVQTTINLPSSGYHEGRLRVGISRAKNANTKPKSVVFNGQTLSSSYMLYDAMGTLAKTKWNVWEFVVPASKMSRSNSVTLSFDGNGGHVTSVGLVAGKLQ